MLNPKKLMKQAQEMQERMVQQLQAIEVTGTAGGGMVTVTMNGTKEVKAIAIKPEVVNPEDLEMLQDLILAAIREAQAKADEQSKGVMGSLMGGLGIPGL